MRCCLALLLCLIASTAHAGLVLTGEVKQFTGAGIYSLEIFAEAVGQQEVVGGSNIALDFSNVGLVGTPTYVANPAFNLAAPVVAISPTVYGVGGTSTASPALTIALGATESLGTITFEASNAGVLDFAPVATFQFTEGGLPISTTLGPGPALSPAAAIPEPSSLAILSGLALLPFRLRRRAAA